MRGLKFLIVICFAFAIGSAAGCSSESTSPGTTANQNGEVQLSDNVVKLLRDNSTMTAAVKAHQEETGLSLSEAKQQVEEVMERDGIVVGENQ